MDWIHIQRILSPLKDYEDLCGRFQKAFSYPFVCEHFNLSLPGLTDYTKRLLGEDSRQRYTGYLELLIGSEEDLQQAGVANILELVEQTGSRLKLEKFCETTSLPAVNIVHVLKFLVYWLVPGEKYLSGLVREEPAVKEELLVLRSAGVKTNLDLLQQGITIEGRRALAEASGLPLSTVTEWVNRADFSRLPWASKATISNIMGAGYCSIAELAGAEPERLYADFFRYGEAIGKNLKLGNEIENSYRIAKIVPIIVR